MDNDRFFRVTSGLSSERAHLSNRIALHFSDVEVQTTNSPHQVAHSGTEGKTLIDTPFSRDPNTSVRCPPEQTSGSRVGNSRIQQTSSSNLSSAPSANAHNPRSVSYPNFRPVNLFPSADESVRKGFLDHRSTLFRMITIAPGRCALKETHHLHPFHSIRRNHPRPVAPAITTRTLEVKAT